MDLKANSHYSISLYGIVWLFLQLRENVYCAVRTGSLNKFTILCSEWPWNGLSISHQPLNAEYQVWSCDNPHDIYGGQSGSGIGFSASTSAFPCQYKSTNAPHSPSSIRCFYQKHKWAKSGNFHKQCSFINWEALVRNVLSHSSEAFKVLIDTGCINTVPDGSKFLQFYKEYRTYSNILLHLLLGWRWGWDLHHNVRWLPCHLSFEALQLLKKKTTIQKFWGFHGGTPSYCSFLDYVTS